MTHYEVTLGAASATVDNLHDALAAAAEFVSDARARLVITCDGEYDEGATELAREGFRPVRPS